MRWTALTLAAVLAAGAVGAQTPRAPHGIDARPLDAIAVGRGLDGLPRSLRRAADYAQALGVLIAWIEICELPARSLPQAEHLRRSVAADIESMEAPLRQFLAGIVEGTRDTYGQLPAATACDLLVRQAGPALLRMD